MVILSRYKDRDQYMFILGTKIGESCTCYLVKVFLSKLNEFFKDKVFMSMPQSHKTLILKSFTYNYDKQKKIKIQVLQN